MSSVNFPLPASGYDYRPLAEPDGDEEPISGWDVFAFQTLLNGLPETQGLRCDGFFGKKTGDAIETFQKKRDLDVDRIAGPMTQTKACQIMARKFAEQWNLPAGVPYGSIMGECGGYPGNRTPIYTTGDAAGSRDNGVLQGNDRYYTWLHSYDTPKMINTFCEKMIGYKKKFDNAPVNHTERRAWQLALGSWNAPAYASYLGGYRDNTAAQPGPTATAALEAYMVKVSKYLKV